MKFVDFHCDTLMRLYDLQSKGVQGESLWENKGHIDLKRLAEEEYTAQFFACYLWLEGKPVKESFYEDALAMADMLQGEVKRHSDKISFAGSYKEYLKNKNEGKVSAFLTIEEGDILEGKIERLSELYEKGIRIITLTWNYENCLGYPNINFIHQNKGLKNFGIEALAKMDEIGIIADVSHLSDKGFEDVFNYGKRPFIATHSNARSILMHERNLTDEMIKKIGEKGGVVGLNFGGDFLKKDGKSTVEAMMKHMKCIMSVGGKEVLCIGTDFDGVEDTLEINGCQYMKNLVFAMEKSGFKAEEIEGICYKNAEKFMQRYFGK